MQRGHGRPQTFFLGRAKLSKKSRKTYFLAGQGRARAPYCPSRGSTYFEQKSQNQQFYRNWNRNLNFYFHFLFYDINEIINFILFSYILVFFFRNASSCSLLIEIYVCSRCTSSTEFSVHRQLLSYENSPYQHCKISSSEMLANTIVLWYSVKYIFSFGCVLPIKIQRTSGPFPKFQFQLMFNFLKLPVVLKTTLIFLKQTDSVFMISGILDLCSKFVGILCWTSNISH